MKRTRLSFTLRIFAVLICVFTLATWFFGGAHRGWTRTRIVEMHYDEITGIEYPVERPGFVPGVEVLGAGLLTGTAFAGAGWLTGRRRSPVA